MSRGRNVFRPPPGLNTFVPKIDIFLLFSLILMLRFVLYSRVILLYLFNIYMYLTYLHSRLFKNSLTKQFKIDSNDTDTLRILRRAPGFRTLGSKSAPNLPSCQFIGYCPSPGYKDKTFKRFIPLSRSYYGTPLKIKTGPHKTICCPALTLIISQ